jgi:beta-galactosidase
MKIIKILYAALIISLSHLGVNISAQENTPLIRFGIIADIQYADCESRGSRFYRNSLQKLNNCIDYLNDHKVQFTINLGDVIDRDVADWDSVLIRLKRFDNKVYNTTGNHDYHGVTDNRVLYDKLKMPSEYYSFKKKNWVFILLNTNEISSYANITGTEKEQELAAMLQQIKSSGGTQGADWNGGIGKKQLKWLSDQLTKAEKSGYNVLIFSHHPLYPESGFTALNNMEILNVISNYTCVKAAFAGHHHAGSFAYYKNIPVVTVEGMIETENDNAFGIIKIYDDKIVMEGQGRMSSRELTLQAKIL